MYGFHKLKGIHDQEFKHPFFRKGHNEYLCYIKRRYASTQGDLKVDIKEGDTSPFRYFDLQCQFNFLSEKVDSSDKEVSRLGEENFKLRNFHKDLLSDNQKSMEKALIILLGVLSQTYDSLSRELQRHLCSIGLDMNKFTTAFQSVDIEHLIANNFLSSTLRTENYRIVVDSLFMALSKHNNQLKNCEQNDRIKQLILKNAINKINNRLVVPNFTNKLSLNVMEDVVETCENQL